MVYWMVQCFIMILYLRQKKKNLKLRKNDKSKSNPEMLNKFLNNIGLFFFRKLKEKRKRAQESNKKRKEAEKEELKQKSLKGMQKNSAESDVTQSEKPVEAAEDDDAEYYRQEVGEEPDKGINFFIFLMVTYHEYIKRTNPI